MQPMAPTPSRSRRSWSRWNGIGMRSDLRRLLARNDHHSSEPPNEPPRDRWHEIHHRDRPPSPGVSQSERCIFYLVPLIREPLSQIRVTNLALRAIVAPITQPLAEVARPPPRCLVAVERAEAAHPRREQPRVAQPRAPREAVSERNATMPFPDDFPGGKDR